MGCGISESPSLDPQAFSPPSPLLSMWQGGRSAPGICVGLGRSLSCSVPVSPRWVLALKRAPLHPSLGLAPTAGIQKPGATRPHAVLSSALCAQRMGPSGSHLRLCGSQRGSGHSLPPVPTLPPLARRPPGPRTQFCSLRSAFDFKEPQVVRDGVRSFQSPRNPGPRRPPHVTSSPPPTPGL